MRGEFFSNFHYTFFPGKNDATRRQLKQDRARALENHIRKNIPCMPRSRKWKRRAFLSGRLTSITVTMLKLKMELYKTGVINDPLGQPTVTAGSDCRFILK